LPQLCSSFDTTNWWPDAVTLVPFVTLSILPGAGQN
jgi:hypothetical protein